MEISSKTRSSGAKRINAFESSRLMDVDERLPTK